MQRYQCHKIVEAAKILSLEWLDDDSVQSRNVAIQLELEDHTIIQKDDQWAYKLPTFGGRILRGDCDCGYFVRYADGCESWSPTQAFEAGYTLISDGHLTLTAFRGYGHRLDLFGVADDYESTRKLCYARLDDFLRRAFFGVDADGNPNPVVLAEEEVLEGPARMEPPFLVSDQGD